MPINKFSLKSDFDKTGNMKTSHSCFPGSYAVKIFPADHILEGGFFEGVRYGSAGRQEVKQINKGKSGITDFITR
jgi:hypothetical protein